MSSKVFHPIPQPPPTSSQQPLQPPLPPMPPSASHNTPQPPPPSLSSSSSSSHPVAPAAPNAGIPVSVSRWFFSSQALAETPSFFCKIPRDKELSYRQQAANFIQDMGQRLQVTQLCINTAIVYMQRFFMFHSFTRFHRNSIASASIFLAAKVEEQPRKLEHVIKVAHICLHRDQPQLDPRSDAYIEQATELVANENILLQTLGFDVAIDHPHTHVVKCCQLVKANKELAQTSYFMATNSLHLTTMCLRYPPTVVACVCIHLATKWTEYKIPMSNEGKEWFKYIDPNTSKSLLDKLSEEFLAIFDKCPSRLKKKIMALTEATKQEEERRMRGDIQANQYQPDLSVRSRVEASSSTTSSNQMTALNSLSKASQQQHSSKSHPQQKHQQRPDKSMLMGSTKTSMLNKVPDDPKRRKLMESPMVGGPGSQTTNDPKKLFDNNGRPEVMRSSSTVPSSNGLPHQHHRKNHPPHGQRPHQQQVKPGQPIAQADPSKSQPQQKPHHHHHHSGSHHHGQQQLQQPNIHPGQVVDGRNRVLPPPSEANKKALPQQHQQQQQGQHPSYLNQRRQQHLSSKQQQHSTSARPTDSSSAMNKHPPLPPSASAIQRSIFDIDTSTDFKDLDDPASLMGMSPVHVPEISDLVPTANMEPGEIMDTPVNTDDILGFSFSGQQQPNKSSVMKQGPAASMNNTSLASLLNSATDKSSSKSSTQASKFNLPSGSSERKQQTDFAQQQQQVNKKQAHLPLLDIAASNANKEKKGSLFSPPSAAPEPPISAASTDLNRVRTTSNSSTEKSPSLKLSKLEEISGYEKLRDGKVTSIKVSRNPADSIKHNPLFSPEQTAEKPSMMVSIPLAMTSSNEDISASKVKKKKKKEKKEKKDKERKREKESSSLVGGEVVKKHKKHKEKDKDRHSSSSSSRKDKTSHHHHHHHHHHSEAAALPLPPANASHQSITTSNESSSLAPPIKLKLKLPAASGSSASGTTLSSSDNSRKRKSELPPSGQAPAVKMSRVMGSDLVMESLYLNNSVPSGKAAMHQQSSSKANVNKQQKPMF